MRYKVTNWMPPTPEGKEFRLEVVYDTFEEVVDKVVRDLNSFWKKMIPQNQTFNIIEVDESTPLGMTLFEDNIITATNPTEVKEAFEIGANANKQYWAKNKPSGMQSSNDLKKMLDVMRR